MKCDDCGASEAYEFRGGYRCEDCADRIIEADPEYQSALTEAIEETMSGKGQVLTPQETRQWSRRLSDEALTEDS